MFFSGQALDDRDWTVQQPAGQGSRRLKIQDEGQTTKLQEPGGLSQDSSPLVWAHLVQGQAEDDCLKAGIRKWRGPGLGLDQGQRARVSAVGCAEHGRGAVQTDTADTLLQQFSALSAGTATHVKDESAARLQYCSLEPATQQGQHGVSQPGIE